jgi:hypothetical protein
MNFKYSVNTTKHSILKNHITKLKDERTLTEYGVKENQSPNFELTRIITPKNTVSEKMNSNSLRYFDKKTKSINLDSKKKISILNKEEVYETANTEIAKISHKSFGIIQAYSAITTEGIVRYENII